jgi:hypothetical protein
MSINLLINKALYLFEDFIFWVSEQDFMSG